MRMKNWKRFAAVAMSVMCMGTMVACGSSGSASNDSKTGSAGSSSKSQTITVVSREDGSGTRGAFIELFGIEEKDASGKKVDNTTDDATITNSTEVMMTTVAGDEAAIGYTSLGALNSSIKALKVDGAEATAANVKSGTYKISRPFNIATNGYISQGNSGAFTSNGASGKIVVAGSSSVTPVMEKLLEAYQKVNTGAKIELQESDSTTGMTAAIDGTCDIGMASRELKDSEKSAGLTNQVIALDGIAVIVNNKNSASNITSEQVKAIFTGETTDWSNVK